MRVHLLTQSLGETKPGMTTRKPETAPADTRSEAKRREEGKEEEKKQARRQQHSERHRPRKLRTQAQASQQHPLEQVI